VKGSVCESFIPAVGNTEVKNSGAKTVLKWGLGVVGD
jgi:hypothetical protein